MAREDRRMPVGTSGTGAGAPGSHRLTAWIVGAGVCVMVAGTALVIASAATGSSASPYASRARAASDPSSATASGQPPAPGPAAPAPDAPLLIAPADGPSTSTTTVTVTPTPPTSVFRPHFDTPEAAMTYLAAAWNRGDTVALRQVTTPGARDALDEMHSEAVNLRLDRCEQRPQGDYLCSFDHDYPPGTVGELPGGGRAVFVVGPALDPGWYMTVLETCG